MRAVLFSTLSNFIFAKLVMLRIDENLRNYKTAFITCVLFFVIAMVFVLINGKTGSFLLINHNNHPSLDVFFTYATYFGDGFIYIPVLLYAIIFNRKFFIPVLAGVIICTLLAQGMKRFVFPDELRPISLEAQNIIIHKIEGQNVYRHNSFPSGHTSTAFTMALLFASILQRRIWAFVLPGIAILVAYSRVYLGQHFVTDIAGGAAVGIIASYLSLWIYQYYLLKKEHKTIAEKDHIPL